ncbi:MAG: sugar transporter [Bacteroidales bacterium]
MSRVQNSIKNSKVGLVLYAFQLFVAFFSRKYFIDYLGSDLLGLNTIAVSLLNFLNLAELGVGAAIAYSLYSPLLTKDREKIQNIISIQAYLYRNIGFVILGTACVLAFFFPYFFGKTNLPLSYAYLTFGVFLFSNLLGYFFNYKQILFEADQKLYKVNYIVQGGRILKSLCQIGVLLYMPTPYIPWLGLEVLFAILTSVGLQLAIQKDYPWLKASPKQGRLLKNKYPDIIRKTKQIFFHKIGGIALGQTTPLIIYAYASLSLVTKYGNYTLITLGITSLIANLFKGMDGSIGNLIAENNPSQSQKVFWELFSFRFWFASVLCVGLFFLSNPFVSLWVGPSFVLDSAILLLIVASVFIQISRGVVDSYIAASGLFQDIWAPILEASINVGLSILLGYYYGLHGILAGVLISLILIICIWKPFFLFRSKMADRARWYFLKYGLFALLCVGSIGIVYGLKQILGINETITSFWHLSLYGLKIVGLYSLCSFGLFYLFSEGMRDFSKRIYRILLNKNPR